MRNTVQNSLEGEVSEEGGDACCFNSIGVPFRFFFLFFFL